MILCLAIVIVLILAHVPAVVPAVRSRMPRLARTLIPTVMVADSLLAGLLVMEFYFSAIHDQSDGFNLTHAGRTWFIRHWKPVNALGYRDREVTAPGPGQRTLVVLGDSFAAGHGVERVEDRFSDVAAKLLGPSWRVYNVARIGWDTPDEIKALREFPVRPDVVVLSYCLNDIFPAAGEAHYPLNFSVRLPTGFMKTLTEHSALADYVYWRLARGGNLSGGAGTFWESLKGAYADPAVWAIHSGQLRELAAVCRERGSALAVVVFPMFQATRESIPLTGKVAAAFKDMGATVMDLSPVFLDRPVREMVVNPLDAHPGVAVDHEVGEMLAARLRRMQLPDPK